LAAFKRPRRVLLVESLPKTATGKLQRYLVRATLGATPGSTLGSTPGAAPGSTPGPVTAR
jgi:acyl-coenzyme A synthetase/AMP-(fatty) acid ligase